MIDRGDGSTYEELRSAFRWRVPPKFNIGTACADRQDSRALALVEVDGESVREVTFGDVTRLSNRLANGLRGIGVEEGDRVAIVAPQRLETALAHLAVYKLGGIAIPMSTLFGPEALIYRVGDAEAKAVVLDPSCLEAVAEAGESVSGLETIVITDDVKAPQRSFWQVVEGGSSEFRAVETDADAPGLLIYTSGTTGPPKGALHSHRVLLGHLPGFQLSHNFFPADGDRFWTPADWAWIGGLMDALLPSWYFGKPVVAARRTKFDPAWAARLIEEHCIRNVFLPPTVLKMMREAALPPSSGMLRSIMCGGEPLGEEMLHWAQAAFDVTVNEIYGQTEANYVVGNCSEIWPVRAGSMGRPYPGHTVSVLDEDGRPRPVGEIGEVAVGTDDPVAFLNYWRRPDATSAKRTGDRAWIKTGDLASVDEEGYLWFNARADDVINSAGYRIGPAEIEECLMGHEAVAMAAAVGVPDPIRGQVVKAYIQLAHGHVPSPTLTEEIQRLVRGRLAAYEYPREVEFVDELPLTTTGKIRRADLRSRAD